MRVSPVPAFKRYRGANATSGLTAAFAPIQADEANSWDKLHDRCEVKRINHQQLDGACTNWAEEFFSRMRRAGVGHHHHIAGGGLIWRERRRQSISAAIGSGI